jgi:nucleotide-binding universal stress UspA family protein
MHIHHILAPTDFSVHANQAVTSAFTLAQRCEAKLPLLQVIEVPMYTIEVALPLADLEQHARQALAQLLPEAAAAQVEVTRLVDLGVPYLKILEVARAKQVDMLVMATHGRTGLGHLVLGSVAERLVRLAPCPVLTIRSPGANTVGLRTTLI